MKYESNIRVAERYRNRPSFGFIGDLKRTPARVSEEEDTEYQGAGLPYFQTPSESNLYRFYIDEPIGEPAKYRNLIQTLISANPGDRVQIFINSVGGQVSTTESIINAIGICQATVQTYINTEAYSAAGMLALAGHEIFVMPRAKLMIHEMSTGLGPQSMQSIQEFSGFFGKQSASLLKNAYEGFITEKEIKEVINGKTLWMDEEEINRRLEIRSKVLQEKLQSAQEAQGKPKKTRRGRSKAQPLDEPV